MTEKQEPELTVETEKTAETRSFRTLMLAPNKSFSQSPKRVPAPSNPKFVPKLSPFLKVSPRVVPRAVIHPAPAIKSLLLGAPLSHCNFMTGSSRAPHKYDHFHEKTYIYDFVPSFQAAEFASKHFQLPPSSPSPAHITPQSTTSRVLHRKPLLPKVPRNVSADRPRLKAPLSPIPPQRLESPPPVNRRPILCLKDGTDLNHPSAQPFFLDLQAFIDRFIGPVTKNTRREVFDRTKVSLRSQAYFSLLETATEALRPKRPFVKAFFVDGEEVLDLALVPEGCQAMLFSYTGEFRGVKGLN